jgi:hypothetical protein
MHIVHVNVFEAGLPIAFLFTITQVEQDPHFAPTKCDSRRTPMAWTLSMLAMALRITQLFKELWRSGNTALCGRTPRTSFVGHAKQPQEWGTGVLMGPPKKQGPGNQGGRDGEALIFMASNHLGYTFFKGHLETTSVGTSTKKGVRERAKAAQTLRVETREEGLTENT